MLGGNDNTEDDTYGRYFANNFLWSCCRRHL